MSPGFAAAAALALAVAAPAAATGAPSPAPPRPHARRHPDGRAHLRTAPLPPGVESFTLPPFGEVRVYAPEAPRSVALLLSGDGGFETRVATMAEHLRAAGALVALIASPTYGDALERRTGAACSYPAGDLEELARTVELRRGLPAYVTPALVGFSSGATFVYESLAQAPAGTFAGGLSLGFCSDIETAIPPCRGRALAYRPLAHRPKGITGPAWELEPAPALGVPWTVLTGELDRACPAALAAAFVVRVSDARLVPLPHVGHGFGGLAYWRDAFTEAYSAIVATAGSRAAPAGAAPTSPAPTSPAPRPAATSPDGVDVSDLGLFEVRKAGAAEGDALAVFLSGDGGWAETDRRVSEELAAAGVPVVGWSSLRYYWTPRDPDRAADDLARVLTHALAAWRKERVLLVGYSFGADVLPYLANRLPAALRARVIGLALIGLSANAEFEFHVLGWAGHESGPPHPTLPEIARSDTPVVCLHGADESDSPCPRLAGTGAGKTDLALPGGHHMKGDYGGIATAILRTLLPRAGSAPPPSGPR